MDDDLDKMWADATKEIQDINPSTENWKIQLLPLARIKKIMKSEEIIMQEMEKDRLAASGEEVHVDIEKTIKFMISGEAPVLIGKACELLIRDLTHRAWKHTERNRRRTLQRQDLHAAVGESEVYDFLIDIVPRISTTKPTAQPDAGAMNAPPMPSAHALGGVPVNLSAGMAPGSVIPHSIMEGAVLQQIQQQQQQQQQQHPQGQQQQPQQQPQQQIGVAPNASLYPQNQFQNFFTLTQQSVTTENAQPSATTSTTDAPQQQHLQPGTQS